MWAYGTVAPTRDLMTTIGNRNQTGLRIFETGGVVGAMSRVDSNVRHLHSMQELDSTLSLSKTKRNLRRQLSMYVWTPARKKPGLAFKSNGVNVP